MKCPPRKVYCLDLPRWDAAGKRGKKILSPRACFGAGPGLTRRTPLYIKETKATILKGLLYRYVSIHYDNKTAYKRPAIRLYIRAGGAWVQHGVRNNNAIELCPWRRDNGGRVHSMDDDGALRRQSRNSAYCGGDRLHGAGRADRKGGV